MLDSVLKEAESEYIKFVWTNAHGDLTEVSLPLSVALIQVANRASNLLYAESASEEMRSEANLVVKNSINTLRQPLENIIHLCANAYVKGIGVKELVCCGNLHT